MISRNGKITFPVRVYTFALFSMRLFDIIHTEISRHPRDITLCPRRAIKDCPLPGSLMPLLVTLARSRAAKPIEIAAKIQPLKQLPRLK
jgi:hypothetical protein